MNYRSRIAVAVVLLAAGAALAVAGFFSADGSLELAKAMAVGFLGLVVIALGVLLLRRGLAERPPTELKSSGQSQPLPHYSRNCPFCGRKVGLKPGKCPNCRRRFPDDSTCSAGEFNDGFCADDFAKAREAAMAKGSKSYVWRAVKDEDTCERCANNDGHVFSWEQEPIGGHAGARVRCRCRPEPVFPPKPEADKSLSSPQA